jgi:hypothetical protein
MRQNVEERACIAKQLASNTTFSKAQQPALEHIFGSDVSVAGPPPIVFYLFLQVITYKKSNTYKNQLV